MAKIRIVDGNNQFFLKYAKATSYKDLVARCVELHWGFDQIFWVFDGYDSRKPRRDLYPDYKNTAARAKNKLDTTKYDMLNDFKKIDLPAIGGIVIVERPHTEADDIIRKIAMTMADGINHIEIASNDADMLNLSYLPNVTQPQAKMPANVNSADELNLYKTLVGDSSDNIKGLRLFGDAAWSKLSMEQRKDIHFALSNNHSEFTPSSCFDVEDKHTIRLLDKLNEHWNTLKIYWTVVNYIEIPDDELMKFVRVYPKQQVAKTQPMTMDF